MRRTLASTLAVSFVSTALVAAPANAEVMVDGIPCHDYLSKIEAKLSSCSKSLPSEMRPIVELGFVPLRGVLIKAARYVKEKADGDEAKMACEGLAQSIKTSSVPMKLDQPGCD